MDRVKNSYTPKEKLRIIACAEAHDNHAAGREFSETGVDTDFRASESWTHIFLRRYQLSIYR